MGFGKNQLDNEAMRLNSYSRGLSSVLLQNEWSSPAASILLPSEKKYLQQSSSLAKKMPSNSILIVVGIGGSNLGAYAISRALLGDLNNLLGGKKILFADTTDPFSISQILAISKKHLEGGGHAIINVISKSGTTLETLCNFDVIYSRLKKISPSRVHVVATSDEGSASLSFASDAGFEILQIPRMVGGRYSVFSNAGLFPLSIIGINCKSLLEGAKAANLDCLKNPSSSPAALMASSLYLHFLGGKTMHVNFLFCSNLHGFGMWQRQLMAESLGKNGQGITPTCAIGTTDLHSMAQLYLGGPKDKTFRFITIDNFGADFKAGKMAGEGKGKSLSHVMHSVFGGVKRAFANEQIPFAHVVLSSLNEKSLGYIMQEQMIETMMLGHLLNVNPFDQPEVEKYKKEAKKLL